MEDKITIKNFVDGFKKCETDSSAERYIKKNLKVVPYLSFITKKTLADKLVDISIYEYEDYNDVDGTIKRRKTGRTKVDSVIQYLLFCRMIIENYTNLEIETDGFFEEYDLLNSCGLMDTIMQSIPEKEITEFKTIIDMTKSDAMINNFDVHNYISNQIERIVAVASTTLEPVLHELISSISNIDDEKIEKFGEIISDGLKVVK